METNFSILMFPWLAHGHVFPFLELAKNLAKKNFKVYFCSTAVNLSSVKRALEKNPSNSSIQLVELHLPSNPDLPPHHHTTKNLPQHLIPKLFEALQASKPGFLDILGSLRPDLVIYDVFQPWAAEQASSLDIPAVHFATSGAAAYAFYYNLMVKNAPFPYPVIYLREREMKTVHTVSHGESKEDKESTTFRHFDLSRDIILMKTCRGFEGKYIDCLSGMCKKEVVPVGALVTEPDDDPSEGDEGSEIMEWLSKKQKFSTVFISMGSENYFSRDQLTEMAKGLESSEANFIWVVRFPNEEKIRVEEALPEGFFDKVKDRGLILDKWAPQARILAHSSTGAFVSHCGASSTNESVYFGVPVVALPLKFDQPLNARLLVEAGVGVEIEKDENGEFNRESVTNAIDKVIFEKTGEEMRLKAAEIGLRMKGEQEHAVNEVAEKLMQLCMQQRHGPKN